MTSPAKLSPTALLLASLALPALAATLGLGADRVEPAYYWQPQAAQPARMAVC